MAKNFLNKAYSNYASNQRKVNWILFAVLLLVYTFYLLNAFLFQGQYGIFIQNLIWKYDRILVFSSIVRNIAYISAIAFAGAWTYYAYIRGRTFQPRLMINIKLIDMCGQNNDVAIVRFTVTNIGKVKVAPLQGCATIQYGYLDNGEVKFSLIEKVEDIFKYYYENENDLFLEPESKVNIDWAIVCLAIRNSGSKENNGVHILMVKAEILVAKKRLYQEITLFNIMSRKRRLENESNIKSKR